MSLESTYDRELELSLFSAPQCLKPDRIGLTSGLTDEYV